VALEPATLLERPRSVRLARSLLSLMLATSLLACEADDGARRPAATDEGSVVTQASETQLDKCGYPVLRPTTLPWVSEGKEIPSPRNPLQRGDLSWLGPRRFGHSAVVTLWLGRRQNRFGEGELAPALPDGTSGVLSFDADAERWYFSWEESATYCGAIHLLVYLPRLSKTEARVEAVQVANSLSV
jgi:hypothetical protein